MAYNVTLIKPVTYRAFKQVTTNSSNTFFNLECTVARKGITLQVVGAMTL